MLQKQLKSLSSNLIECFVETKYCVTIRRYTIIDIAKTTIKVVDRLLDDVIIVMK